MLFAASRLHHRKVLGLVQHFKRVWVASIDQLSGLRPDAVLPLLVYVNTEAVVACSKQAGHRPLFWRGIAQVIPAPLALVYG